jgi:hypothetical protein
MIWRKKLSDDLAARGGHGRPGVAGGAFAVLAIDAPPLSSREVWCRLKSSDPTIR